MAGNPQGEGWSGGQGRLRRTQRPSGEALLARPDGPWALHQAGALAFQHPAPLDHLASPASVQGHLGGAQRQRREMKEAVWGQQT